MRFMERKCSLAFPVYDCHTSSWAILNIHITKTSSPCAWMTEMNISLHVPQLFLRALQIAVTWTLRNKSPSLSGFSPQTQHCKAGSADVGCRGVLTGPLLLSFTNVLCPCEGGPSFLFPFSYSSPFFMLTT